MSNIENPMLVQIGLTNAGGELSFITREGYRLFFGEERIVTAPKEDRKDFMGKKYNFQVSVHDGTDLMMYPISGTKDPEGFFEWTHILVECRNTEDSLYLAMNHEWKSELFQSDKH